MIASDGAGAGTGGMRGVAPTERDAARRRGRRDVSRRVRQGELLRWYLTRARHPLKDYLVGHYWSWFSRHDVWIAYDEAAIIRVSLGDYLHQRIFFEGHYERALIEWLKTSLRPTDVFWDVGANIGAITLIASPRCRRVVAFEPDPHSAARLSEHLTVNACENVELVRAALSDATGGGWLHRGPASNTGMGSLLEPRGDAGERTPIDILRADDFVRQRPDAMPSVIKVDVEGAEHLVLRGARDLLGLRGVRAVVFEDRRTADSRPSNRVAIETLLDAGFAIAPLGPSDPTIDDGLLNFLALRRDA